MYFVELTDSRTLYDTMRGVNKAFYTDVWRVLRKRTDTLQKTVRTTCPGRQGIVILHDYGLFLHSIEAVRTPDGSFIPVGDYRLKTNRTTVTKPPMYGGARDAYINRVITIGLAPLGRRTKVVQRFGNGKRDRDSIFKDIDKLVVSNNSRTKKWNVKDGKSPKKYLKLIFDTDGSNSK